MLVRLDAYARVHRSMWLRAMIFLVFGSIGVVVSSAVLLMGVLLFLMPDSEDGGLWARRSGVVVGGFGGVFPLIASVVMVWRGIVGRSRLKRMRELAAFARVVPSFTSPDVARALHLSPLDVERLLLDASSMGLMEEGPLPIVVTPSPALPAAVDPAFAPTMAPLTPPRSPSGVRSLSQAEVSPPPIPQKGLGFDAGEVLNGTYRIEGKIGAGGMGVVYEARHLRTGRRYAIKTLPPDQQVSPDALKRFEREAKAASALGHPGIVAVHDFHTSEGGIAYLVMDRLDGETLDQRLGRVGSLPWQDARRIALEVADAVASAHEAGLLHRDLKPANIFMASSPGGNERAVVLDFGLVKAVGDITVSSITTTGSTVGTPMYMSPEQARGEALDVRSDVYSLAAVVYEMVTGAPPFLDATLASVYARLLTESAPSASSLARYPIPPLVDDVLSAALAKARDERFDSMRAFAAALGRAGEATQKSA